jgi:AmmeMemoRadiSam system protein A
VPAPADTSDAANLLLNRYGPMLLATAAASINHGLDTGAPLNVAADDYPEPLRSSTATFVTLEADGHLRGCVGSAEAHRPLIEDVAANAFAAAFRDSRFPPLTAPERDAMDVSVSLLSPPEPIEFAADDDLLEQLRPGIDGLILEWRHRRALFLPQVWTLLPTPEAFLAQLKRKALIENETAPAQISAWRFRATSLSSASLPGHVVLWG